MPMHWFERRTFEFPNKVTFSSVKFCPAVWLVVLCNFCGWEDPQHHRVDERLGGDQSLSLRIRETNRERPDAKEHLR